MLTFAETITLRAMDAKVSSPQAKPGALRERLTAREDSEHVQALIRIAFGLCVSVYLYLTVGPTLQVHVICVGFEVLSLAILAAILIHPQRSAMRQGVGAVLDLGTTTYLMWANGEAGAPLYGIYVWVTFGNGFRYGVRSLYFSHALSLTGFVIVVVFGTFWRQHPLLAGGLLVLLAAVPAYGAILLREVQKAHRSLHEQAMRDVLTGLYNRRYLIDSFERELHRARRTHEQLGVMVIDIDHFKQINDSYGHAAGDEVLRSVAQYMLTLVRAGDMLCRFGGEEFVLLQHKASIDALIERAEKLREDISRHEVMYHGQMLGPVTLSIGVALYPLHGSTPQAVLYAADRALYAAKHAGRNRVVMGTSAETNAASA